jgi:selenocysteine lyase/cysteine desulfurase
VHGFANQDVDVAKLGADFFAAGTHKWLMAPRGTGFLWGKLERWRFVRSTIPSFDPDGQATWNAWMQRYEPPVGWAAFVSPGGFIAYEHMLAIPAAVALHRSIGRAQIASRIAELNNAFRRELVKVPGVTMHTPLDPALSGGLTCYEVAGMKAEQVTAALAARKIRTVNSPYKVSLARVSAGVMNFPEDLETALRAIRALKA